MATEVTTMHATNKPACWGLFGTMIWGSSIIFAFLVLQFIAMIVYLVWGEASLTDEQLFKLIESSKYDGVAISLATLVTTMLCVPIIIGIAKLKSGSRLTDYLALNVIPYKTLGLWLGATVAFIAISDTLSIMLGESVVPDFMASAYASANPAWLIWLALVVGAPLFEEVFFRGFLFKGLEANITQGWAIIVTAALWAILHIQYDAYGIGSIFFLGILFGLARAKTNSIFTSLAMHAITNVVANIEAAMLARDVVA